MSTIKVDLFYGLGTLGTSAIGFVVSSWLLYFYLPPDGEPLVPVAIYGIAILLGRIASAVITPFVGYISDNFHSRWGRRLPLMFIAALPLLIFFFLFWQPPLPSTTIINLIYLIVIAIAYRTTLAVYTVPYRALLPEIALTDRHRIRLSALQSGFLVLGMVVGSLAGVLIERRGFPSMALVYGLGILILIYIPFFILRERPGRQVSADQRISFKQSLSITVRNRPFVIFALVWAAYLMTTSFVQSSAPFIVTELCLLNKADTLYFYIPGLLAAMVGYPLVTKFAGRWGKWKVYAGSLIASAIVFPGTVLIGDWLPIGLKVQCTTWAVLQSFVISGVVVLSSAFVAEITDFDFDDTGQHREGMYFAAIGVLEQIFNGVASVLLPLILLLGRSHTSPLGPLGVRLTGLVGGLLMMLAFFVFLRYPYRLAKTKTDRSIS